MSLRRQDPTATVLTNGKVLVAGGSDGVDYKKPTELFDPASGTWATNGVLNTGRYRHTATLLTNGTVLVAGGYSYGLFLGSAETYDPATGHWTTNGSFSPGRDRHTATLLTNGLVLVAGGLLDANGNDTASAVLYNPATGTWANTGSLARSRERHTATLLPNGKVLAVGGATFPVPGDTSIIVYFSSAELYNPTTGTWTSAGSMSVSRSDHRATLLPNGKVLITGGESTNMALATAELYDPVANKWTSTGSLSDVREHHEAVLLPNGKVLVAGGSRFNPSPPDGFLASAEIYDPATGTWSPTSPLHWARFHFAAALLGNSNVFVAGGYGNSSVFGGPPPTYGNLTYSETYNQSNVTVTAINLTSPAKIPGAVFQFGFTNTPGVGFIVYGADNQTLPFLGYWTVLGGATEISPGHYLFTDYQTYRYTTYPWSTSQRFYRVRAP